MVDMGLEPRELRAAAAALEFTLSAQAVLLSRGFVLGTDFPPGTLIDGEQQGALQEIADRLREIAAGGR